jgi:hypothetical protein
MKTTKPKAKYKIGDVVVVTSTLPNFKFTVTNVCPILHGAKGFVYENGERGFWEENEIELFDPNKKYPFTA